MDNAKTEPDFVRAETRIEMLRDSLIQFRTKQQVEKTYEIECGASLEYAFVSKHLTNAIELLIEADPAMRDLILVAATEAKTKG